MGGGEERSKEGRMLKEHVLRRRRRRKERGPSGCLHLDEGLYPNDGKLKWRGNE